MLKFIKNLLEIRTLRKNVCYIKDSVMYSKWGFPTAQGSFNPTYANVVNKDTISQILKETQNYKTILQSPNKGLDKKFSKELEFIQEAIVYGLEQKKCLKTGQELTIKLVKTKKDLMSWAQLVAKIYPSFDADFIYASFKCDLKKPYASYFIGYKDKSPVATSQVIRGGGYSAIYWVGILDGYRNNGLGEEITKRTINYEINNNRCKFLLTASSLGLRIYKKIGFKPVEKFYTYNFK